MTRPKRTLDPAEVDDMLSGTWQAPVSSEGGYGRARNWVALYDRCANCDAMQPCLVSFSGDSVVADDPRERPAATRDRVSARRQGPAYDIALRAVHRRFTQYRRVKS